MYMYMYRNIYIYIYAGELLVCPLFGELFVWPPRKLLVCPSLWGHFRTTKRVCFEDVCFERWSQLVFLCFLFTIFLRELAFLKMPVFVPVFGFARIVQKGCTLFVSQLKNRTKKLWNHYFSARIWFLLQSDKNWFCFWVVKTKNTNWAHGCSWIRRMVLF